eukprot:CCRYP_020014-RB/>CCRYP_020014-RB protein AED:0.44 eAED:0.44 QI:232/1/0.66/1/0/0/3/0/61
MPSISKPSSPLAAASSKAEPAASTASSSNSGSMLVTSCIPLTNRANALTTLLTILDVPLLA